MATLCRSRRFGTLEPGQPAHIMTGLSERLPILGHHGGYAAGAALISGRQIVLALLAIAVVSVILWIPVLSDRVMDFLSRNSPRYAPLTFVAGFGFLGLRPVGGNPVLPLCRARKIRAPGLRHLFAN